VLNISLNVVESSETLAKKLGKMQIVFEEKERKGYLEDP